MTESQKQQIKWSNNFYSFTMAASTDKFAVGNHSEAYSCCKSCRVERLMVEFLLMQGTQAFVGNS